jgi:hypothetical protein
MIKHGLRTVIIGTLVLSVLFFIILPHQYPGFSVKPYLNKIVHLNFNFSHVNPVKKINPNSVNPDSKGNMVRTDRLLYIPVVVVSLIAFLYGAYYFFVRSKNKILARQMTYFKVIPFGSYELKDIGIAKGFLISLAQNLRNPWDSIILGQPWFRYIMKKNAGDGLVEIYFGVPADRTQPFLNSFGGYYDMIQLKQLSELEAATFIPDHKRYKITSFTPLIKDPLPIKMYEGKASEKDPLDIIIASMGGGKPSDVDVVIDVLMKPIPEYKNLYEVGAKYINRMRKESFDDTDIPSLLADHGDTKKKQPKKTLSDYEKDYIKVVKERCTAPEKAFKTSIKIYAGGQGDILMALKSASDGFSVLNAFNSLASETVLDPWRMKKKILQGRFGVHEGFTLSSSELVGFIRIPDNTLNCFAYIDTIDAQIVRAPQSISSENVSSDDMFLIDAKTPIQVHLDTEGNETLIREKHQQSSQSQNKPIGGGDNDIIVDMMEDDSGMGDMGDVSALMKQFEQQTKATQQSESPVQQAPIAQQAPLKQPIQPEPQTWEDSKSEPEIVTHVIKDDKDDGDGFQF